MKHPEASLNESELLCELERAAEILADSELLIDEHCIQPQSGLIRAARALMHHLERRRLEQHPAAGLNAGRIVRELDEGRQQLRACLFQLQPDGRESRGHSMMDARHAEPADLRPRRARR